jgi:Ca2+-binding EF-hand superfamily protein
MLFKQIDTDTNGILNEDEFKQLIAAMHIVTSEDEILRLLQLVDPYNNQRITFSECLSLLATVLKYQNLA